ncbi:MAG: hypothetical protein ACK55I_00205, partial [bacterium]
RYSLSQTIFACVGMESPEAIGAVFESLASQDARKLLIVTACSQQGSSANPSIFGGVLAQRHV